MSCRAVNNSPNGHKWPGRERPCRPSSLKALHVVRTGSHTPAAPLDAQWARCVDRSGRRVGRDGHQGTHPVKDAFHLNRACRLFLKPFLQGFPTVLVGRRPARIIQEMKSNRGSEKQNDLPRIQLEASGGAGAGHRVAGPPPHPGALWPSGCPFSVGM